MMEAPVPLKRKTLLLIRKIGNELEKQHTLDQSNYNNKAATPAASRNAIKCCKFIEQWNKKNQSALFNADAHSLRFTLNSEGQKVYTIENEDESAAVICVNASKVSFKAIADLWDNETDIELRKGQEIHWKESCC